MDSFEHNRELSGIWIDGKKIDSDRVAPQERPLENGIRAEIRIAKEILQHEMRESGVEVDKDLIEIVREEFAESKVAAFGAYLAMASGSAIPMNQRPGVFRRLFARPRNTTPKWIFEISDRVREEGLVIVIDTFASVVFGNCLNFRMVRTVPFLPG